VTIFLNGQFVSEEQARVSVFDRGFTYGDGVFETMRVLTGGPSHWSAHIERLQRGLEFLKIRLPVRPDDLRHAANCLMRENGIPDAVLRLVVSRGPGMRGYSPRGADTPTLVMTIHAAPQYPATGWRLKTSTHRLQAGDPLLEHKTCNKLLHILARDEADREGFDDALLLNNRGEVVTVTCANLFWITQEAVVCTPPVSAGALPGVTRAAVKEICAALGVSLVESAVRGSELEASAINGVFVTLSSMGIIPVTAIDGRKLARSALVERISREYARLTDTA
jgi:branched-chain amino acid aminotransferase